MMGKWCLHASLFIFDQIIRKVAGNQDRHKSSVEFYFGPDQTTHFGVTCPWVTKISHFWTWISLKPVGQSWSNFMCSIIGVGERLHKVLGQIDLGTLDSGERSLPFGLLVQFCLTNRCLTICCESNFATIFKSFSWHFLESSLAWPDFLPIFKLFICAPVDVHPISQVKCSGLTNEPHHEKTYLQSFQPGKYQTSLHIYRD